MITLSRRTSTCQPVAELGSLGNCKPQIYFNFFKPTGRKPLGTPEPRWEESVRIDRKETGANMRNWAQDMDYWIAESTR